MKKKENKESAIKVQDGIEQPSQLAENAIHKIRQKRKNLPEVDEYTQGILSDNRTILSQAITLIESNLEIHYKLAQQIIEKCLPYSGNSIRIGITGVPGVGKSSFIETFGTYLTGIGCKVAVLAIDPSSERSRGSILGDKTRMGELSIDPNAFIRPSPSAGTLGGVARKTREIIILCEAAGFDTIIVETVGVGQSETAVHSMVDFFLLLMLAGAGDELQGIKRGIMEMADAIAITKTDGENITKAFAAKAEYAGALHLFPPNEYRWSPVVETCSAHEKEGIDRIWDIIMEYETHTRQNGYFTKKRQKQSRYRMLEMIDDSLISEFYNNPEVNKLSSKVEKQLIDLKISSYVAAQKLLDAYFQSIRKRKK